MVLMIDFYYIFRIYHKNFHPRGLSLHTFTSVVFLIFLLYSVFLCSESVPVRGCLVLHKYIYKGSELHLLPKAVLIDVPPVLCPDPQHIWGVGPTRTRM